MASPSAPTSGKRRGRPSGAEAGATRARLIDAAHAACLEVGFDQVTLADIATRAGVTPAAVYNHFTDKGQLLFEAVLRALEDLTAGAVGSLSEVRTASEIAAGYLAPGLAAQRRLLLQIHHASDRDEELRSVLADWHQRSADQLRPLVPADVDDPVTVLKTFYLVLLGLCHLEQLSALEAPADQLTTRVGAIVDLLFGGS